MKEGRKTGCVVKTLVKLQFKPPTLIRLSISTDDRHLTVLHANYYELKWQKPEQAISQNNLPFVFAVICFSLS